MPERSLVVNSGLTGLLEELIKELKIIYGDKLKRIILYGSYARGQENEGSDLDIMVLVSTSEKEIKRKRDKVLDLTVDLTTRFGIVLSIIENNHDYFYEWLPVLPFFASVEKEGVNLYAS